MDQQNKAIVDVCCGSRMFWFDRQDDRVLFLDKRSETHELKDSSSKGGYRNLVIQPDSICDFTSMPFKDGSFKLVVFDPPHLVKCGKNSWLGKKYGILGADWKEDIRAGFSECFRILEPLGIMIFKWSEKDITVSTILKLTPERPLFGNRCGKHANSHWIVFMKGGPDGMD